MERFIAQDWIVDEFYLDGVECKRPCLGYNIMELYKNGKGKPPRLSGQERSRIQWSILKMKKGTITFQ